MANQCTDGFREGAAKGRETSFQNAFNEGFEDGARFGKMYGFSCGVLKGSNDKEPTSLKTNCKICLDSGAGESKTALVESVYETPYEDLKAAQNIHNDKLETELRKKVPNLPAN